MMGFAGPMGASWCDYLFGDVSATPSDSSVYQREKIVFMPDSFFCNDHLQSNPDSFAVLGQHPSEARSRDTAQFYRDKLFPHFPKDAFIMANFNQLYKIEPTTFLIWLRILERLPNSYLWLLRFPKSGEANLLSFAKRWTGPDSTVVSRIIFTDVVDKPQHLSRCHASDLFLDTPECNAHTTAVDVLWAGTPIVTYPRHVHKLCSRIATSVIKAACTMYPDNLSDYSIAERLITHSEREYEERVVHFGSAGRGELETIRRYLLMNRERSALFNTARWVSYLETAYEKLWTQWCNGTCDHVTVERETG
jgi:predicted O-linked N-acetylglucosamine transferase (SPINDLY family)